MSASVSDSSDRENEALRRAQRAHEPSMEEILASIRAIIADDRDAEAAKSAPAPRPAANTGPQIVYSNDSPSPAKSAGPAEVESPPHVPSITAIAPNVIWARPNIEFAAPETVVTLTADPEQVVEPEARQTHSPAPEEAPLLSEEADRAVSASFQALSSTLQQQSAELVESLTREMLRPMIKTWLDENLPSLVERLVRAEIQRVARGGR
jgi:cell pole-organizing protein PopZ